METVYCFEPRPGVSIARSIEAREQLPASPGVVLIEVDGGPAYLGRTQSLRRRVERLLGVFGSRALRICCEPTHSPFESAYVLARLGREAWPQDYRRRLRLRAPALVKAHLSNRFPRTSVTNRLTAGRSLYYGPFATRATAERFEQDLLDYFGVRRCVENLDPTPEHPGCVWGEMGKCVRPCQEAVGVEGYRREWGRLLAALESRGESLSAQLAADRDEASAELDFERASALHERLQAAQRLFGGPQEPARDLDRLHAVIVQRGAEPEPGAPSSAVLFPLLRGRLQEAIRVPIAVVDGRPKSLDGVLRESIEGASFVEAGALDRHDSMALLRRWLYSSWRRGEIVLVDAFDQVPYRRLVNAVSRVAQGRARGAGPEFGRGEDGSSANPVR